MLKSCRQAPTRWAHNFFMETMEHLFFIPAILAIFLPFVARVRISTNWPARSLVLVVAVLIALNGLAIEEAGAIINWGAETALAQTVASSAPVATKGTK